MASPLKVGAVVTIALDAHAAGTAWNGKSGAYATILDADEADTEEKLPAVFVVWSDVHAIRAHNPAQA